MSHHAHHPVDIGASSGGMASAVWGKLRGLFVLLAVVGAAGSAVGWFVQPAQFYHSYLTAFLFVLTMVLGMLFFVMLHHVVDAGWSVVVRRAAEQTLASLPVLAVMSIPLIVGLMTHGIYHWMDPQTEIDRAAVANKWPLLTPWFYIGSVVVCFGVWMLLSRVLRGSSIAQDADGAAKWTFRMRRWSAPGMLLYAVTFTIAAVEWVMTLDYHWFSTIFGIYVWSGGVVGSLAVLTLMTLALARGPLNGLINSDHLHDLGKLLFAFTVFWAYIAFSQYFLIWYANIPEETIWFLHRWEGGWKGLSVLLPVGQFVVPFVVMMSAVMKRKPAVLAIVSMIVIAMHWLDLYWMIMPAFAQHHPPLAWLWIDAAAVMLVIGVGGLMTVRAMSRAALYPVRDPRLAESLSLGHVHEEDDDAAVAAVQG